MAALAPALSSPGVTQADACFHCATPLPRGAVHAVLGGRAQAFCCAGCATAAQWIVDARLDDYYRLRSQAGGRPSVDGFDAALWDREDLLPEHTVAVEDAREIVLLVEGMRCAACAWLIDRALASTPGARDR